jgi:hypothetical protein
MYNSDIKKLWMLPLVVFMAAQALFSWQWGTEENCSPWSMPQDFVGCEFFNYQNGWAKNNPITFVNWDNRKVIIYPYCFMGVLTTICSFHDWPDISRCSGYLNIGDSTGGNRSSVQNSRLMTLDHTWQYGEFRTGSCETDDPAARNLSSCPTPGECLASDEITRLYAAVMLACNGNYNNGQGWGGSIYQLDHILETRLGFPNVREISGTHPSLVDTLRKYLYDRQTPVIGHSGGHAWVIDGYRLNGSTPEIHILNYGCSNSHISYWDNISTYNTYFYNIDPDFSIAGGEQVDLSYKFGDSYVPNTSSTYRNSRLYVKSEITGSSIRYSVVARAYTWTGSEWGNPVELLNSNFWTNSSTGAFETYPFSYHVSNDSLKVVCTVSHNYGSTISQRALLRDYHDEDRFDLRCNDTLQTSMIEGGNMELEGGESNLPINGDGFHFRYSDVTVCRAGNDGFLYRAERIEDDGTWLDNPSNLVNYFVFRNRDGVVTQCIAPDGTVRIRKQAQAPISRPLEGLIQITGPTYFNRNVGENLRISWEYSPDAQGSRMIVEATYNDGRTWEMISTEGSVPVEQGYYDWTVTSSLGGTSICSDYLVFRISDYSDTFSDEYFEHPIKIYCP